MPYNRQKNDKHKKKGINPHPKPGWSKLTSQKHIYIYNIKSFIFPPRPLKRGGHCYHGPSTLPPNGFPRAISLYPVTLSPPSPNPTALPPSPPPPPLPLPPSTNINGTVA